MAPLLLALALLLPAVPTPAEAGNAALIVVNREYRDLAPFEPGDVETPLRTALEAAGFEVSVLENATTGGLLSALRRMAANPDPNAAAVFYYVGYARQLRGRTFVIARNAKPSVPFDFVTQGVDLDSIVKSLADAGGRLQVAVIDGAYPEPLLDGLPGLEPGLAEPAAGPSTAVVLGAAPGTTLGGPGGGRQLAEAFAAAVDDPRRGLGEVLARFASGAETGAGRRVHVALGAGAADQPLIAAAAPEPEPAPVPQPDPTPAPARDGFVPAPGSGTGAAAPAAPAAPALSPEEFEATLDLTERQRVQFALRQLGLYTAAIDGDFGPRTRAGIETFQRLRGLEPTGMLDAAQLRLLYDLAGQ